MEGWWAWMCVCGCVWVWVGTLGIPSSTRSKRLSELTEWTGSKDPHWMDRRIPVRHPPTFPPQGAFVRVICIVSSSSSRGKEDRMTEEVSSSNRHHRSTRLSLSLSPFFFMEFIKGTRSSLSLSFNLALCFFRGNASLCIRIRQFTFLLLLAAEGNPNNNQHPLLGCQKYDRIYLWLYIYIYSCRDVRTNG